MTGNTSISLPVNWLEMAYRPHRIALTAFYVLGLVILLIFVVDVQFDKNFLSLNAPPKHPPLPVDLQINYWKPWKHPVGTPDIQIGITLVPPNATIVAQEPISMWALAKVNGSEFSNITAIHVSFGGASKWYRTTQDFVGGVGIVQAGGVDLYSENVGKVHYYTVPRVNNVTPPSLIYWSVPSDYPSYAELVFNNGMHQSLREGANSVHVDPPSVLANEKATNVNTVLTYAIFFLAFVDAILLGLDILGERRHH